MKFEALLSLLLHLLRQLRGEVSYLKTLNVAAQFYRLLKPLGEQSLKVSLLQLLQLQYFRSEVGGGREGRRHLTALKSLIFAQL